MPRGPSAKATAGLSSRAGGHTKPGQSSKAVLPPPLEAEDASSANTTDSEVSEEDEDDEENEEDALNFEMDGQELWNQNYCSVCDCLIEPGTGVGPRRPDSRGTKTVTASTATTPATTSPVLRSKSGTIKGRHSSTADEGLTGVKRNGSHTSLSKRSSNGSSHRLSALSDLKPTTRINHGPGAGGGGGGGENVRSPKHGKHKSTDSASQPPSPALPRSRKGGLLDALKQQEEDLLKEKAPPALYCSERCRTIDEESTIGATAFEDLNLYVTTAPFNSNVPANTSPSWSPLDGPYQPRVWPRAASTTSIPAGALPSVKTPDSEWSPCMCADCIEKSSAGGTVPSGASDTTESSYGMMYGRRTSYRKERTRSGRVVTPHNLHPPGAASEQDGYFPVVPPSSQRNDSVDLTNAVPERASSAASGESSTQSSGSFASIWEPKIRQGTSHLQRPTVDATSRFSMVSENSVTTTAETHGTLTPGLSSSLRANGTLSQPQLPSSQSVSLQSGASPLRLLRRDTQGPQATSPDTRAFLPGSMASERTLGTSASTLMIATPSGRAERRRPKGRSLVVEGSPESKPCATSAIDVEQPALSQSYAGQANGLDALTALRAAAGDNSSGRETHRRTASTSAAPSTSSSWLRSLSSAWSSLRPPQTSPQSTKSGTLPDIVLPDGGSSSPTKGRARASSSATATSSSSQLSQLSRQSSRSMGGGSPGNEGSNGNSNSNSNSTSALSRSAASESLSKVLSASSLSSRGAAAAATSPNAVARPGASRGSVPAFASEIGRGAIPGEAESGNHGKSSNSVDSNRRLSTSGPLSTSLRSDSAGAVVMDDEERRRRRRAQRSKEVTMLPPLLAPSNRSATHLNLMQHQRANSYANLNSIAGQRANSYASLHSATATHHQRRQSRSRYSIGSTGSNGSANFTVGSAGSERALEASNEDVSASGSIGHLPHTASQQDVAVGGSHPAPSPRRANFGWTASMTPITPSAAPHEDHSRVRPHHPHAHRHHSHRHASHHHTHSGGGSSSAGSSSSHHAPPGGAPLGRVSSRGSQLGHLGMLGHHPHGSQPAYGRHNTMPVRTSTPIVPEDGGEMSAEALTALTYGSQVQRPLSAAAARQLQYARSSLSGQSNVQGTIRPSSSAAARLDQRRSSESFQGSTRMWSYDNLAAKGRGGGKEPIKTYSVLQLPPAEGEEEQGQQQQQHQQHQGAHSGEGRSSVDGYSAPSRRKQLFHFGP